MTAYMSKSINLAGYSSATLTFWYKIPSIESGNFDKLRVYMDSTIIWERTTAQTAWTQVTLSLNSYVGSSRTLKFEFYSDGSGTAEGAYLDDILVTATAACTDDSYEQDDTAGTAKSITSGTTQNRTICPGDEDWAYFTVSTAGSTAVITTGARSGYTGGDTEMWLYGPNSSTTQIAYNDDSSGLWSQITVPNLPAGTYYIRIQEYGNNGTIDGYTLFLDVIPSTNPCAGVGSDSYEPDDTAATAKTISDGETQNRAICPAGNEDWARFTVSTAGSSVLLRTGTRSGYAGGDTVMWLYGPNSSTTQVPGGYNDDANGAWSQISLQNLAAGTYYVRIQEYGNNGTIDGYTLFLDATPIVPPADDHGNTIQTATAVSVNSTTAGNIEIPGDVDYSRVTLANAGRLSVFTTGATDTYGYLKNSSGNDIASDDDTGGLGNFRMTRDLPAGIYYVSVRHYRSTGTGPYQFGVEFSQPIEPPLIQLANRISQGVTDYFADQYQNHHKKWLFTMSAGYRPIDIGVFSVGPSGEATMNLDLADVLEITPEGRDGFITVWIDGGLSLLGGDLSTPVVTFGATPIEFDPMEPDPRRSFSVSFLSGSVFVWAFDLGSWDSDSGFGSGAGWVPRTEASVDFLETSIGLFRLEVHRSIIEVSIRAALDNGLLSVSAPLPDRLTAQRDLFNAIALGRSGSLFVPPRLFTGKDDGTHVDNTAAIEHFGINARNGSWINNLEFPIFPDLFGIPLVGWETAIRVRNVGNNTSRFFVKAVSWPSG